MFEKASRQCKIIHVEIIFLRNSYKGKIYLLVLSPVNLLNVSWSCFIINVYFSDVQNMTVCQLAVLWWLMKEIRSAARNLNVRTL